MATVKTLAKPFVRLEEGSEQFAVEQLGQASQASTRVSKSLTIDICDFRGQKTYELRTGRPGVRVSPGAPHISNKIQIAAIRTGVFCKSIFCPVRPEACSLFATAPDPSPHERSVLAGECRASRCSCRGGQRGMPESKGPCRQLAHAKASRAISESQDCWSRHPRAGRVLPGQTRVPCRLDSTRRPQALRSRF